MASEGGEIDVVAELSRDEGGTVWLVLYYDQGFSFFFLQDGKFWPRVMRWWATSNSEDAIHNLRCRRCRQVGQPTPPRRPHGLQLLPGHLVRVVRPTARRQTPVHFARRAHENRVRWPTYKFGRIIGGSPWRCV
jgi:hypothetical protein